MPEEDNFIELSQRGWKGIGSIENINTGCLQRIAAATEMIASNYQRMENDLAYYKRRNGEMATSIQKRDRQISALRGVITKMKNKFDGTKTKK